MLQLVCPRGRGDSRMCRIGHAAEIDDNAAAASSYRIAR